MNLANNNGSINFHPVSWSQFPFECLLYLIVAGLLQLIAFGIGCLALAVIQRKQPGTWLRCVGRFGLFLGLLLLVGSLFNGLWSCLVWGRLYYSTDYFVDFAPFWPITQERIDRPFGDLRGQILTGSLFQLELVWLLFALSTWGVTIYLYRTLHRTISSKKSLEPTSPSVPLSI
jgi:hypothetical protein